MMIMLVIGMIQEGNGFRGIAANYRIKRTQEMVRWSAAGNQDGKRKEMQKKRKKHDQETYQDEPEEIRDERMGRFRRLVIRQRMFSSQKGCGSWRFTSLMSVFIRRSVTMKGGILVWLTFETV